MRFLISFRIQWLAVIALVGATTTAVGCGSPMKMVKPSGMATGSPYAISGTEVPGIPVPVVAIADVSSRGVGGKYPATTNESGLFVVAEDVMQSDGTVLVKTGAHVNARVTRKKHTRLGRPGWLEVAFLSTQSTSGAPVRLDEQLVRFEGKSRRGGMIAGAVSGAVLNPLLLLLLLLKGGDVTLQAGSTFIPNGSILELPGLP